VNFRKAVKVAIAVAVAAAIVKAAVPNEKSRGVPSAQPKDEPCPKRCRCSRSHTEGVPAVDVQCCDKNLRRVPEIIDNGIQVSILNLSFNPLKTLTQLGCQLVKYLYLQYCKLYSIDEKAFYSVKNLTVVDLSDNHLISIPPNVFADNQLLDKLILRNNYLYDTDPNTPLLTGPHSLTSLDL
jgi:hypothetical protein